MKNRIIVALCIVMIFAMSIAAYAIEVPDLSRKGTVTIEMTYMGEAVPGGSLTAYRVAEVVVENGADHSFGYTEAYIDCTVDITDLTNVDLANELAAYTKNNAIAGTKLMIGDNGKVKFEDLALGLYLFIQEEAADGYTAVSAFVVSVPAHEGESYVYDVDATPKISTMPETVETTTPPETTIPPETTATPEMPPKLPQTGQLKWPIPFLTVTGAMCIVFGAYLIVNSKRKDNEN